ncbi:hypothetical protein SAMN05216228_100124 [Rhizobium tibeticum]|uniref:Uncharacterized protein n=1 Tax=Rhizobium tibeticum TaxID=501024 RepID=A0A1H8C8M1_9HYPH|nr:hypothetical protein [Rhizobium tibeticum]SEH45485.1 hypothetical protein RTCCBAU85039_0472 [Rhizobium tibeticum]SEM90794.1 hypothetical protein SAMN05216228_100124 [Rhizobium tibeticum]
MAKRPVILVVGVGLSGNRTDDAFNRLAHVIDHEPDFVRHQKTCLVDFSILDRRRGCKPSRLVMSTEASDLAPSISLTLIRSKALKRLLGSSSMNNRYHFPRLITGE